MRFAAHYGNLDNLGWLAAVGFDEAGIVVPFGQNPSPWGIKNAGIGTATLNCFNDGACPPGTAGAQYAGYFQSIRANGWDCCGGEGVSGDVVATVENYMVYLNYGGIIGDDQAQGMYASPWNHPATGGHWDYIETYNNSFGFRPDSAIAMINNARANGAGHLGILIGDWMQSQGAQAYINIVDATGCDTICFWGGYSAASSGCQGLAQQLIDHYGASHGGAGGGIAPWVPIEPNIPPLVPYVPLPYKVIPEPTPYGSSTPTTSTPGAAAPTTTTYTTTTTISCPCRHIWLGISGENKDSSSEHIEFQVKLLGTAGWVNDDDVAILGKKYTGQLEAWCSNSTGLTWKLADFWPDENDGSFALIVGSDVAEKRTYSVKFADQGIEDPYKTATVTTETVT